MTKESRFNGEYKKTGSEKVTDADNVLVKKADEKLKKSIPSDDEEEPEE
jgi:hypothetical protein